MNHAPDNELFSAYLDGEATAEERAEVERLLAQDAGARQWLDELRALSAKVRSLPVRKMGEDLTAVVLRAAEREMLSASSPREEGHGLAPDAGRPPEAVRPPFREPATPAPAGEDSLNPEPFAWRPSLRRMLRPRNLIVPAVAVAAALMLAWLGPPRHHRAPAAAGDVAMAPALEGRRKPLSIGAPAGAVVSKPAAAHAPVAMEMATDSLPAAPAASPAPAMAAGEKRAARLPVSSWGEKTLADEPGAMGGRGGGGSPVAAMAHEPEALERKRLAEAPPAGGTLVLCSNVRDPSAAQRLLRSILRQQQVALNEWGVDRAGKAMAGEQEALVELSGQFAGPGLRAAGVQPNDLVLQAHLSSAQFDRTLKELEVHRQVFPSLVVGPTAVAGMKGSSGPRRRLSKDGRPLLIPYGAPDNRAAAAMKQQSPPVTNSNSPLAGTTQSGFGGAGEVSPAQRNDQLRSQVANQVQPAEPSGLGKADSQGVSQMAPRFAVAGQNAVVADGPKQQVVFVLRLEEPPVPARPAKPAATGKR
jgi:hypothetical protein